ncbi:hypothetical protein HIM_02749 [Hirsutella minnesotensis 3608]|nr:hypothetical protein HIM_02749 [Hirsutella minnesotensis 3608]
MPPRAKPVSSLSSRMVPDSDADLDDLDSLCADTKPVVTTTRRARGRPPSFGVKTAKPVPKAPRGIKRKAEPASTAAEKRKTTGIEKAEPKHSEAAEDFTEPKVREEESKNPKTTKSNRGRPKAAESRAGSRLARPSTTEPVAEPRDRSESIGIPETQGVGISMRDELEDGRATAEDPLLSDNEMKLDMASPEKRDSTQLRKSLRDLMKKYEDLEVRHRELRNIGIKAAERNFDRIKKQAEENFLASNELISQLKADLAAQLEMSEDREDLRHQLGQSEADRNSLESTVDELKKGLSTARTEIATLTAKLSANRNAEANAMVPGSTRKPGMAKLGNMAFKTEMSEVKQLAQAKEDLYGDLTGLIVRGMRREDEEDVFDCIQTGRNGTLHFKLAIERATPTDNYESVQLTYKPQLDTNRDNELMELLPDYLVEEITFPRSHASKFYSRVMKSLSERMD